MRRACTCTRAHIASWPVPQYSWHGIRCSPVLLERGRERRDEARDEHRVRVGRADDEAVDRRRCSCARNVTGMSAGTTMHCGSNEYCCAMSRTITLPSGAERRAEIALDELALRCAACFTSIGLHARGRHRGPMQPGDDHHRDQQRDDDADDDRPAALGRDGDGLGACAVRPIGRHASRSLHGSPRQVDEEIEREVDRHDDGGRDARDGERARRPAAHDLVDLCVLGSRSPWSSVTSSRLLTRAGACAARSTCAGVTGVPLLPHATRM